MCYPESVHVLSRTSGILETCRCSILENVLVVYQSNEKSVNFEQDPGHERGLRMVQAVVPSALDA